MLNYSYWKLHYSDEYLIIDHIQMLLMLHEVTRELHIEIFCITIGFP